MIIGIPRALLYYQYYPLWKTFFEELGAKTVISPPTSQLTLAEGSSRVVAETCLPVKIFIGHVFSLSKICDYIFIPALRSIQRNVYNCSKFLGLPDMTRAVIPKLPPILDIDIDINRGKNNLYWSIYRLGRLFTWNPFDIRRAAVAAWQTYLEYKKMMLYKGLTPPQAIAMMSNIIGTQVPNHVKPIKLNIALIGHPYILYDEYINHRLLNQLYKSHCNVLTPEMITHTTLKLAIKKMIGKAYWTYEEEVVGAGEYYLNNDVDGIIGLMAFGCGPDSVMMDIVGKRAKQLGTTIFMNLILDEHTADAGINTRLEAFVDMIHRKKELVKCA